MSAQQAPGGGTVGAVGGGSVAGIVSPPGIDTHQQRQVIGGGGGMTPNQSAMVAAGGGSGPSTPKTAEQSTHKGIKAVLREITTAATPDMFAREFQRQIKVRNVYLPTAAAKYWDEATSNIQSLRLYGTMKEGSNLIRLFWGFGKY